MVGGLIPAARLLDDPVRLGLAGDLGRGPHVIEPPSLILLPPIGAVGPPRIVAFGRRDVRAADIRPAMRLLEAAERLAFYRGVADDLDQCLVVVDVAFER